ncbi:MAG: ABC transporter permease subunit, partial [Desulfobacterales bacterium]|nr:ABC transporter permease subunit [Desulfobacterales bacterium]
MNTSKNSRTFAGRSTSDKLIWIGFFICLFLLGYFFYFANQRIQYIWHWERLPIFFYYQETVEIITEIDGEVAAVSIDGKEALITVKGAGETETYKAPAEGVSAEKGDLVSPGDLLASYKRWRPGLLILGLWLTLQVSVFATIIGVIIGIVGGLARISSMPAIKWTSIVYIELIRGSPLMVQILIWYFVIGTLCNDLLATYGFNRLPAFWYAVASLAFFAGAYVTEIVRAGIQSIHRGQTEAARSLGMSYAQSMLHIILPQALRRIMPPLAGQFISLIKDSSLLGMIAIRDLTKA